MTQVVENKMLWKQKQAKQKLYSPLIPQLSLSYTHTQTYNSQKTYSMYS